MVGVTDRYDGRSIVLAERTRPGALDAVVANQRGPLMFYRNDVAPRRHWIDVELEGGCRPDTAAGTRCSNRSAIGAQVKVFWSGQQQVQEVSGGSGFCSQNQRRLHFGVGDATAIDKIVIRWPSGVTSELPHPQLDQVHRVKEPV